MPELRPSPSTYRSFFLFYRSPTLVPVSVLPFSFLLSGLYHHFHLLVLSFSFLFSSCRWSGGTLLRTPVALFKRPTPSTIHTPVAHGVPKLPVDLQTKYSTTTALTPRTALFSCTPSLSSSSYSFLLCWPEERVYTVCHVALIGFIICPYKSSWPFGDRASRRQPPHPPAESSRLTALRWPVTASCSSHDSTY